VRISPRKPIEKFFEQHKCGFHRIMTQNFLYYREVLSNDSFSTLRAIAFAYTEHLILLENNAFAVFLQRFVLEKSEGDKVPFCEKYKILFYCLRELYMTSTERDPNDALLLLNKLSISVKEFDTEFVMYLKELFKEYLLHPPKGEIPMIGATELEIYETAGESRMDIIKRIDKEEVAFYFIQPLSSILKIRIRLFNIETSDLNGTLNFGPSDRNDELSRDELAKELKDCSINLFDKQPFTVILYQKEFCEKHRGFLARIDSAMENTVQIVSQQNQAINKDNETNLEECVICHAKHVGDRKDMSMLICCEKPVCLFSIRDLIKRKTVDYILQTEEEAKNNPVRCPNPKCSKVLEPDIISMYFEASELVMYASRRKEREEMLVRRGCLDCYSKKGTNITPYTKCTHELCKDCLISECKKLALRYNQNRFLFVNSIRCSKKCENSFFDFNVIRRECSIITIDFKTTNDKNYNRVCRVGGFTIEMDNSDEICSVCYKRIKEHPIRY